MFGLLLWVPKKIHQYHQVHRSWTMMPPEGLEPNLAEKATRIQVLPGAQTS